MANVFQASTGYRDPQKAMTLKALEARAKAAQEAVATSMEPTVVADPMQGWAGLLGTLGAKVEQGRTDSAAASGRADLANIMAGVNMDTGPNMADIARIGQYDPELAQRMYEQAMETRQQNLNREDTQSFQAGESELERQQRLDLETQRQKFEAGESELTRKSTAELQEDRQRAEEQAAKDLAANQEKQKALQAGYDMDTPAGIQAAADAGLISPQAAQLALTDLETKRGADVKTATRAAEDPYTGTGDIEADYAAGAYGAPGTERAIKLRDEALAAENIKGTPTPAPQSEFDKAFDKKEAEEWSGYQSSRTVAAGRQQDLAMLQELTKTAPQGPLLGNAIKFAEKFGIGGLSTSGAAFNAIVKRLAPTLRVTGSGSTSDLEYQGMLDSLAKLENYPEANAAITAMMQAKAAIDIERGDIIDRVRNGEISKAMARAEMNRLNSKSIMPDELRAIVDIPARDTTAPNPDDELLGKDYPT